MNPSDSGAVLLFDYYEHENPACLHSVITLLSIQINILLYNQFQISSKDLYTLP